MPLYMLDERLWFPPVEHSLEDGLMAIGGDLSTERLLLAYRSGIFPWFSEDEPPMWWCPDPRFVLFPSKLKISGSMKRAIRQGRFEFRINSGFEQVIRSCSLAPRPGQDGTWITEEIINAYSQLHEMGYAHSAEAWSNGQLIGGLYGIRMGNIFFGESMFSKETNASKFAFIQYVRQLEQEGVALIDCQVYTPHLESLGAEMIPRKDFMQLLSANL
jgi:leucyl/phenylalanyl-tRNA--protein transferase